MVAVPKPNSDPFLNKAEESKTVYFCGCERSGNKPVCDGTHGKI
ncbi:MAG TPA: CDGSH iron-sulfur domain-containing protein [Alphaproteobacteria bacterium]|nr:CDGSH iron-sulfur domain-containing protein [Alphaproteobacteria bacterium]